MIFNTFISRWFGSSKHHPTHLHGIQPVPLPTDYLWRQLYDDTTLEQASVQHTVPQALGVRAHPDKTFIGKVAKGFDFLGFHCRPTGMGVSDAALSRRDQKIARLYEQGASPRRIGRYLARWLGWVVMVGAAGSAGAEPCNTYATFSGNDAPNEHVCHCSGGTTTETSYYRGHWPTYPNGNPGPFTFNNCNESTLALDDGSTPSDPWHYGSAYACSKSRPQSTAEVALRPNYEYFFKNTSEANDYFSCTTDEQGYFVSHSLGLRNCGNDVISDLCPGDIRVTVDTPNGVVSDDVGEISSCYYSCPDCRNWCTGSYDEGSIVTLTATPGTGYSTTWSGADAGSCSGNICTFSNLESAKVVTASFSLNTYPVHVTVDTSNGSVSADVGDISGCTNSGGICSDSYDHGTNVILTAIPDAGYSTTWSGADAVYIPFFGLGCRDDTCNFANLGTAKAVTASFSLNTYPVNVTVDTANGNVSADVGDISGCTDSGGICSDSYDHGTTIILTATPAADHVTIWSGPDAGSCTVNTCNFNDLSAAKSVTASFLPVLFIDGFENNP